MARVQKSHGRALVRWVGLAMVLPALVAVALLGKDAAVVIKSINDDALKRETAAVERGITLLGEIHASELLSQTLWDEAFRNVVISQRADWIEKNFGPDSLSSDGTQHLVILDPHGKAIYSSDVRGAPPPESVAGLLAAGSRPIAHARALYREARAAGEGFGERLPGAMTDGIYVNDVIRIDGHPAMITVSPFAPDAEGHQTPPEPTLLIGVRMMTKALLDKLEAMSHIANLSHVHESHAAETGRHALPVRDAQGNVVTHLTWDFTAPAQAILKAALPAILLSLGLIALLTTLGAVTMRRLTRRLAESEQAALHASRHDAATGLANRGWFMRTFADLLQPSREGPSTHAVLLIDCDDFKIVNDTLGHAAGDAVLHAIAERLKALDGRLALAARLGGDEFALLSAPLARTDEAAPLAESVRTALMKPVLFETHVIAVSVSIGAATFDAPSPEPIDAFLLKADQALYRAKRDGRGCARLYDPALDGAEAAQPPAPHRPDASGRADTPAPTIPAAA